ncbi:MAG: ABC transporter permease, partial [Rhodobacteraceae bacterium]|nr:ABC transporter permease [Paracoccaceae bacterium]
MLFGNAEVASLLEGFVEVNVDKSIPPGIAIADIGVVQRLFKRNDLSRLMIIPEQPIRRPDLVEIAPELVVQPSQQIADVAALTDSFHLNLTAFGFLSFAVGLFIVHSTIGLAFEQRRGMIRTLRSLGVPLSKLLALIIVEMGL